MVRAFATNALAPCLWAEGELPMTYYYGKDSRGEWRWHLKGANHRIVAVSSEGYKSEEDCTDAITLVKSARDAPVKLVEKVE
jgi:hypothetical protein